MQSGHKNKKTKRKGRKNKTQANDKITAQRKVEISGRMHFKANYRKKYHYHRFHTPK